MKSIQKIVSLHNLNWGMSFIRRDMPKNIFFAFCLKKISTMGELPGEASLVGDVFSCRQLVQVLQTRNAQRAVGSDEYKNTKYKNST